MAVLTYTHQEIGRSQDYSFSTGRVCAALYARLVSQGGGESTVAIKLTRIISGSSSGVGYSYDGATASISGAISDSWSSGASGMVYVGEHVVFEREYLISHSGAITLNLQAVYDDTYITQRSISAECTIPSIVEPPAIPLVSAIFDAPQASLRSTATVSMHSENADYYHLNICKLNVPGDPSQDGVVLRELDVYGQIAAVDLSDLGLAVGDDLYFMVQAHNEGGGSVNGFSTFYRIRPLVLRNDGGTWKRSALWVKVSGTWAPANRVFIKQAGEWREIQ